jgi:hypothetical protein
VLRLAPGLIMLAALAGCGSGQKAGNAANAAAPANSAAAPAPGTPAAPVDEVRGLAEFREDVLRGCIAGGRETAAPGVPVERHCACAVERTMAGKTLAELQADERAPDYDSRFQGAIRACIAETRG